VRELTGAFGHGCVRDIVRIILFIVTQSNNLANLSFSRSWALVFFVRRHVFASQLGHRAILARVDLFRNRRGQFFLLFVA
jgi:hypothetical protein